MRKCIKKVAIILFFIVFPLLLASCQKIESKEFTFASYKTKDAVPYDIYFDEEKYFSKPASEYNPELASASACLALSGFSTATSTYYKNADSNAKNLFKVLGFNNYLANEYGTKVPTDSSFGVFIASKQINDYTLIGITVRGSGYMMEWASNFNIGNNDEFAQGFFEASEIYLNFLKSYIERYNITGNIKIWTAGYSRGGATVNLATGRIDDGLLNNENIISDKVSYTKDDIYSYCYEAPAGKVIDLNQNEIFVKGSNYSNIHNILNLNDPVPFVAPLEFSFVRYGEDLFLPDIITDLNYEKQIKLVKNRLTDLPNYESVGDYKLDQFKDESIVKFLNYIPSPYVNVTPYIYVKDLINSLCTSIGNKEHYVDVMQKPIMEFFKFLFSHLSAKDSAINLVINIGKGLLMDDLQEVALYDLQNHREKFIQDFEVLVFKAFKKIDLKISITDVRALTSEILKLVVGILFSDNGFVVLRSIINMTNVGILGSAHVPELLLTHITSLDENYDSSGLTVKNSFNIIKVKTESEFELTIDDDEYIYFEDGELVSNLVMKKTSDGYDIYIPADAEFKITSNNKLSYELYNHNNSFVNDKLIQSVTL